MASANAFDLHSEDHVKNVRILFREQAARFLEDVSFDVGAVLARDLSLQDEDTKNKLSELQKGLSEQVLHMQKVIKKEKSVLIASSAHRKKEIHFTQTELKTLKEIAKQENDDNGVVTMFLKRREEGVARNRYREFVKRAETKFFEHRRDGRKGKFDFRHIIRDSMRVAGGHAHHPQPAPVLPHRPHRAGNKNPKANRVPNLIMPGVATTATGTGGRLPDRDSPESEDDPLRPASSSSTTDAPALPSASRSISAHPSTYRSTQLVSARWNARTSLDADREEVRLIIDELAETVDLLVDFEHQPFHTAVPPSYPFYRSEAGSDSAVAAKQQDPRQQGESTESDTDERRTDADGGFACDVQDSLGLDADGTVSQALPLHDDHTRSTSCDREYHVLPVDTESDHCAVSDPATGATHPLSAHLPILHDCAVLESEQPDPGAVDDRSDHSSEPFVDIEPECESAPPATLAKPTLHRSRSNSSLAHRFMAPKKLHNPEPVVAARCHKKGGGDDDKTAPNRGRRVSGHACLTPVHYQQGRRSRSPWRYPERFPQIPEVPSSKGAATKKAPGPSPLRNQSVTKLPDAK